MALVHYPVVNKNGDVIASAVTNLDLHDISRAAKTYGVRQFYVVTPLEDQRTLVKKLISHWVKGFGAQYNPKRRQALELVHIKRSLDEVIDQIRQDGGQTPKMIVTSARPDSGNIDFGRLREMISDGNLYVLILGTAWGLTKEFIDAADFILDPVMGTTDYNHLSVRSAAAIILDRLFGRYQ
jgi:hypothetical protein